MAITPCSECDEDIEIPGRARLGQKIICIHCGAALEVVATDPLEVESAQEDDYDLWDEDELEDEELAAGLNDSESIVEVDADDEDEDEDEDDDLDDLDAFDDDLEDDFDDEYDDFDDFDDDYDDELDDDSEYELDDESDDRWL